MIRTQWKHQSYYQEKNQKMHLNKQNCVKKGRGNPNIWQREIRTLGEEHNSSTMMKLNIVFDEYRLSDAIEKSGLDEISGTENMA